MNLRIQSLAVSFATVALLAACGGGGGGEATPAPVPAPTPTPPPPPAVGTIALARVSDEAAGANCASGGRRVEAGIDVNSNLSLDAAEVQSTQFLCEGSSTLSGTPASGVGKALVAAAVEPVGANCRFGGRRLTIGADGNGNGSLDAAEVTSTQFACYTTIQFVQVTDPTQAAANVGYIAANAAAPVVVTLPASASLSLGDIVHVRGSGAGGWRIAQNDGQTIEVNQLNELLQGAVFVSTGIAANWHATALSSDGGIAMAAANGGRIHVSRDGGATWTQGTAIATFFTAAMSADGTRMIAGAYNGQLHLSTNSGSSFSTVGPSGKAWSGLAVSSDGTRMIASAESDTLYRSTDGGQTWSSTESSRRWSSVATSSDGLKMIASVNTETLFTSTDGGATWTPRASAQPWIAVASSADGTRLMAGVSNGRLWRSTDSGVTWAAVGPATGKEWRSITSSADGTRLAAVAFNDGVWVSNDSGTTWTMRDTSRAWWSVASTADGKKLLGAVTGAPATGSLQLSNALTTSLGTPGSLSGGASASAELEYLGNGRFRMRSFAPTVTAQ